MTQAPALRRSLGLWRASLSGVGVILGAGVYALIAPAAGRAGGALWIAFLVAGVAAALTAYSYARLGRLRPRNSPEFQYTALAFGPRAGFVAGWLMLAADLLAAATVTGHRALGWFDAGTIGAGQRADLVTVATDSVRTAGTDPAAVVFTATAADVRQVMVDGRVVVRDGAHVSLDVPRALREAIGTVLSGRKVTGA